MLRKAVRAALKSIATMAATAGDKPDAVDDGTYVASQGGIHVLEPREVAEILLWPFYYSFIVERMR